MHTYIYIYIYIVAVVLAVSLVLHLYAFVFFHVILSYCAHWRKGGRFSSISLSLCFLMQRV